MDMDLQTTQVSTSYNKPVYGFFGNYTLTEGVVMPYLSATLDLERAIKELKTYDQIPPNLDMRWSLQELYQREIDYDRIEKELVNGYLKDPHKIKFFNAITIMLFPREIGGTMGNHFSEDSVNDPRVPIDDDRFDRNFASNDCERAVFGGVQFIKKTDFGRLRWDEQSVIAVAVDGQHRVCALRKWYESLNNTLSDQQKNTKVPVIFLIPHEKVGFKANAQFASIRQIAREIFTDLNKNAKKVDEAREIILDDKSLDALAARTLVTSETTKDSETLLPLSLVRWQDANARFDQGFFLNSLVHLHQIVQIALNLRIPKDPMEIDDCLRYIESLDIAVGSGSSMKLSHEGVALSSYYKQNFTSEDEAYRPLLHLPESFLIEAAKGFESHHKPYLLRFLLHFKPYQDLLLYARQNQLISGFFSQWFAQPEEHKRQLRGRLEKEDEHWERKRITTHIEKIQEIKGRALDDHWGFKNIFQKSCVRLLRLICFNHQKEKDRLGDADTVVQFLDQLYCNGLLKIQRDILPARYKLWTFIALHVGASNKIKVSARTENNLYQTFLLAYYINRKYFMDKSTATRSPTIKSLIQYFSAESHKSQWPGCVDAHNHLIKIFKEQAEALGANIEGKSKDEEKTERERVAEERLISVMQSLALSWIAS